MGPLKRGHLSWTECKCSQTEVDQVVLLRCFEAIGFGTYVSVFVCTCMCVHVHVHVRACVIYLYTCIYMYVRMHVRNMETRQCQETVPNC